MGAITGTALQQLIEDTMVSEICKKNTLLCVGKDVTSISYNLTMLYNYWVLCDLCDLTDSEVNCIVNDISATCKFAKPYKLNDILVDNATEVSAQVNTVLSANAYRFSRICSTKLSPIGQVVHKVTPSGGKAPYTYVWTCQAPIGFIPSKIGVCGSLLLLNTTTDTMTATQIVYGKAYAFKVIVTDALGNTVTKIINYDDALCQIGAYPV